jgi:hypothetical protein
MMDAFKRLVESGVIGEDVSSELENAFNAKIQENRDQVTANLREEFAQKYDFDRKQIIESLDKMVGDRLAAEMAELVEDKKGLVQAKVAYQHKVVNDSKMMEAFVIKQLGKELGEFQNDRKKVSENFSKLEQFIVTALAREINEFSQDKRELAEAKVKLVREAKKKFDEVKQRFIQRSAGLVQETVTKKLTSELSQLREDIESARRNAFGRKMFEAFAQEYSTSYLNEKSETSKLLKILQKKDAELAEAQSTITEKQRVVESKDREVRVAKDLMERRVVMGELLAPLSAEQKGIMKELLESTKTQRLNEAFDKYLPAVMEGKAVKPAIQKAVLTEGQVVTGDREVKNQPQIGLDNILDIRKLAGLSK